MNGYIKSIGTIQNLNELHEDEMDYKFCEVDYLENLMTNDSLTIDSMTNR